MNATPHQQTIAIIMAHPDDETFTSAVTIHQVVQQGHRVVCLLATNGEAGKSGRLKPMTKDELSIKRREEMTNAASVLGLAEVRYLGYPDGRLASVDRNLIRDQVAQFIRDTSANIIITFPEDGISGHKDHTAIHHAVREVVTARECPSVRKLYYAASLVLLAAGYIPSISYNVMPYWTVKKQALLAHESQILSIERVFGSMGDESTIHEGKREEKFILAWENGVSFPVKNESSLTE
jgi:LmbE family N-acetylglucosaminyl deacetylase